MVAGEVATSRSSITYRRQARRLRCVHAGRAERLQPALHRLARTTDAAADLDESCAPPTPHALFAQSVLATLDGPVLRYSRRLELLDEAKSLGLGRFEANLVIALVEHRRGAVARDSQIQIPKPIPRWMLGTAAAVALQFAILALAYVVLG